MLSIFNDLITASFFIIAAFLLVSLAHIFNERLFTATLALSLMGLGMIVGGIGLTGQELLNPAQYSHLLNVALGLLGTGYGLNVLIGCYRNWRTARQLRPNSRDKTKKS